ncbi:MAG: threo-3-hydroxy-L-aspartate ammonia-lyase [Armatimonadetes bacterium]|nr:threo-3-hydroxy-L-aspartate ammonia-lyase [Armatimonadota bacterium]MBS1711875.1 threo-3-hydroxy-L-aspartate ammonia-lyase [Armatimonadota bacterium]MBX3109571.1 threo-3-hydroxy-L-aspartate ammonia-lyase [Fimbriimonadaceae bacterium]
MVTFADVAAAHDRIAPYIHRTPVRTNRTLNEKLGASVYFKCENFQVAGAFKYRGATNALLQLGPEQRERGVMTYSSGNHAQALARAGQVHGVRVTVVMPNDAPRVKRAATEGYGAEVILYDRDETNREELSRKLSQERGLSLIPPYDHAHIVAGAGTAVKEMIQECGAFDEIYIPVGGGGLLSGSAVAAKTMCPGCRVVGVEPEAGDDICRSFASGKIETVHNPETIADGARTPSASDLTFSLIREHVDEMASVPDSQLLVCMAFYAERMKMVVEPTGSLSLAPLLGAQKEIAGKRIGVVISGGNVDLADLSRYWGQR